MILSFYFLVVFFSCFFSCLSLTKIILNQLFKIVNSF
nr:MAG TPA: hypothetical protein [Caudoviricetes sp.]